VSNSQKVFDTPWRAWLEVRRLLSLPYIRVAFALRGMPWSDGSRVYGAPMIQKHRGSKIEIGKNAVIRSWTKSNPLLLNHPTIFSTRSPMASIRIGDDCGFSGAVIVAAERIDIGNRVSVGSNSIIVDTDFHPLDPQARLADYNAGSHKPVIIEDDVFIGMNAIVLKGVRIGKGSVVGAGAVVSSDVPAGVIVSGNPARVVRELRAAEAAPVR
jgi:acetyltransferase-like isoleucine patch superfamily enzyme